MLSLLYLFSVVKMHYSVSLCLLSRRRTGLSSRPVWWRSATPSSTPWTDARPSCWPEWTKSTNTNWRWASTTRHGLGPLRHSPKNIHLDVSDGYQALVWCGHSPEMANSTKKSKKKQACDVNVAVFAWQDSCMKFQIGNTVPARGFSAFNNISDELSISGEILSATVGRKIISILTLLTRTESNYCLAGRKLI